MLTVFTFRFVIKTDSFFQSFACRLFTNVGAIFIYRPRYSTAIKVTRRSGINISLRGFAVIRHACAVCYGVHTLKVGGKDPNVTFSAKCPVPTKEVLAFNQPLLLLFLIRS